MVGAEWPDTGDDFEKYILPLFRTHGIRFVQVARKGHLEKDGIVILDDSRATERLYMAALIRSRRNWNPPARFPSTAPSTVAA